MGGLSLMMCLYQDQEVSYKLLVIMLPTYSTIISREKTHKFIPSRLNELYTTSVNCEIDGITCNNQGSCGPGNLGCVCDTEILLGKYCESTNHSYTSGAMSQWNPPFVVLILIVLQVIYGPFQVN